MTTTPNEVAGLIKRLRRQAKREVAYYDAIPQCVSFVGVEDTASWQAADMLERLSPTEATEPRVERVHPSLEICIQFDETGQHIRKWSRVPFVGGECLYSHPAALSASISNAEACSTCQGTGIDECPGYYEGQAECPHCEGTGTTEGRAGNDLLGQ